MATRSTPTEKNPNNPITTVRKASCKNLAGSATLHYELGTDAEGTLYWRITRNSGGGYFNDYWVAFSAIRKALEQRPKDSPITAMALREIYRGGSANSPSFLLATCLNEGIAQLVAGKRRQYGVGDIAGFVRDLDLSHSKSRKAPAKAKSKARSRMRKAPADSATAD